MAQVARKLELSRPGPRGMPVGPTAQPTGVAPVQLQLFGDGARAGEWVSVRDLCDDSPGATSGARERFAERRWHKIRRENPVAAKRLWQAGRAYLAVAATAVWNLQTRQTAGELATARRPAATLPEPHAKPTGWDEVDDRDRQRHAVAVWARQRWKRLLADFPHENDAQRHCRWVADCRSRLKGAGIGASPRSAARLCAWNPANAMYSDGRRQRGADAGASFSESFRGELLYVALKVYRGAAGTLRAAYKVAAGFALKRGETPPSYGRARVWFNEQVPESHRLIFHDPRRWERRHVESVRRDYTQFRPMALWSGDWHRCDFRVFHRGKWVRPWLCIWEDFGSRMICGLTLAVQPDTDGLLAAFARGVTECGAPTGVFVDNGHDFASKGFAGERGKLSDEDRQRIEGVCGMLEVKVSFCWPFNPGSKPPESWFRTFCLRVAKLFHTYCGNTPENRPPELQKAQKDGRVEPISLADAERLIVQWVETVYHREPHSGDNMNGRTPLEAFADNPLSKRTAPEHLLAYMLLKPVLTKVTRRGVRYLGSYYDSFDKDGRSPLFALQGQYVKVLAPYGQGAGAGQVEVATMDGEPICTAFNSRLDGTQVDDVKQKRRRIRGAKKQIAAATELMKLVAQPIDEQCMIEAQARFVREQTRGRVAVGSELQTGSRPLQPLRRAADLIDALPAPRASGRGVKSLSPLDAAVFPAPRRVELVNPLDEVPLAEDASGGTGSGNGLLDRDLDACACTESVRAGDDVLDALPDLWADGGAEPRDAG